MGVGKRSDSRFQHHHSPRTKSRRNSSDSAISRAAAMNRSDRPAFGRAIFRAGIQSKNWLRDFLPARTFSSQLQFLPARRTIAAAMGSGFAPSAATRCRYSWIWCAVDWETGNGRWEMGNESFDFRRGAFSHFPRARSWRDRLRQEKIPPWPRVTDALRNSGQPAFNRRTRRVRQHQRQIEFSRAHFSTDSKNAFARNEGDRFRSPPDDAATSRAIFPA